MSKSNKFRLIVALLAVFSLIAAGCGSDDDESAETTEVVDETPTEVAQEEPTEVPAEEPTEVPEEEPTEVPAEEPEEEPEAEPEEEPEAEPEEEPTAVPLVRGEGDLVIWADDTRTPVLRPFAEQFAAENGISVVVQELVPFGDIDDRVVTAGPAGEGPDIFVGAHDQLGGLVASGIVAPVELGAKADLYAPSAIQALNYEGQNYGLPYSIENIALIRNVDLVPDAPATFEELETIALALLADGTVDVPLAMQQNPADPFHNFPLFTSCGGYVFGVGADGAYDPNDLGIDSAGGIAAATQFQAWANSGLITPSLDYDGMINAFAEGRAPFAITGPWAVPSFSDINYTVEPIPSACGGEPQPFVGVQALMVSAFAENPLLAQTFLVDFLATEEAALALYEADPRPPALISALEAVSDNPDLVGFGTAGANGLPMPAIPAMGSVWSSWTDAYDLVFQGTNPAEAFNSAGEQIRNLIEGG